MPRRARIALPNVPLHLIQRGNNRQPCFFADEDYRNYLDWLGEYAGKTGCSMLSHASRSLSARLPALHRTQPGAGRHGRASCRLPLVQLPGQCAGEENHFVQPHERYLALGLTPAGRQANYRELFRHELDPGMIDAIRNATNGNFALGDNRFAEQVAATLGRRVVPGKPGRPMKAPEPELGSLF